VRHIRLLLAILAAVAGTLVATESPALAATQGPYIIQPWGAIYDCAYTATTAQSAPVLLTGCAHTVFNQQWYWQDTTDGYYRIFNRQSGKCLNAAGATTSETTVIQYGCSTSALNDPWKPTPKHIDPSGPDYYILQNRLGGLCLSVHNAAPGRQLYTSSCNDPYRDSWWTWSKP